MEDRANPEGVEATVAILAQGTHRAVAFTQAFLCPGSSPASAPFCPSIEAWGWAITKVFGGPVAHLNKGAAHDISAGALQRGGAAAGAPHFKVDAVCVFACPCGLMDKALPS